MIMTATALASVIDAAYAAPCAESIPGAGRGNGHIAALVRELTASWRPASTVADRRREHRLSCDLPAELVPLDISGRPLAGSPLAVEVKDLSRHGIGIAHRNPMPHRLVLVTFETADNQLVRAQVRLKWCRFKGTDLYESGGQIVRVLTPFSQESPAEPLPVELVCLDD